MRNIPFLFQPKLHISARRHLLTFGPPFRPESCARPVQAQPLHRPHGTAFSAVAVCVIRTYFAGTGANVIVVEPGVPWPSATGVHVVPFVETSTLYSRGYGPGWHQLAPVVACRARPPRCRVRRHVRRRGTRRPRS